MPPNDADIIIAGAGLSGLSLAAELQVLGYPGRVVMLDSRIDFSRDQRWCTWGPVEETIAPLASHSWTRCQVIGERVSHRLHTPKRPYTEFQAPRMLSALAGQLESSPTFELRLGTAVDSIINHGRWAEAHTSDGMLRAKWVIDARGDGALGRARTGSVGSDVWLWQSFVGFTVKTSVALFEPGCATLMDFRTLQTAVAEFFYVLPYSSTCALVECTVVDGAIWPLDRYREHLEGYLARLGLRCGEWICESEEIGAIPMTTHAFPTRSTGAVIALGVAAGAAKPSTGYGFARSRRQARAVARSLADGLPPRLPTPGARNREMDAILLNVIARHPQEFRRGMLSLFERADAAAIVRFLSEESSLSDDLRVASVVGSPKFAAAAMRRYGHWR